MKRMVNGIAIGLITLVAMAAGLFISRVIWLQFHHHYEDMPHGWFNGHLSLHMHNFATTTREGDEAPTFSVVVKGRTSRKWYWWTPTNFSYEAVEMQVGLVPSKERVTVELPSLAYRRKGQQGALTPELLAQWIAEDNGGSVNTRLVEQTTWFIDCLRRANQESLPTPRHHNYYTDSFIPLAPPGTEVVFQHFLLGGGFWWLDGVFLLGVPIALIWFLRRRSAPDSGNFQDVSHQEPQDVGSA